MPDYMKSEARAWAREQMRGVIDVIIPSFKRDLSDINEAGIRHDVRRNVELGFVGALLVSEVNITLSEYARFVEVAAQEAAGKQILVFHAMFNTLEENIEGARLASAAGATAALLPYPPGFHPRNEEDVRRYTAAFCDATDLAVILFPLPHWNFERFSPASMSMDLLERLINDHPNIAVVKAEGGYPYIAGFAQAWRRFSDEVVVTMPLEPEAIPLMNLVPMQLIATSNTEYFGDRVPRAVKLASEGSLDAAMDLYWSIAPARAANANVAASGGTNVVHRGAWKYQAWLNGYNGGPLRVPTARLVHKQMAAFRKALVESGIEATDDDDELFLEGRTQA
jgi:4-hydroxy-tetrahydrodipicolinate synthase